MRDVAPGPPVDLESGRFYPDRLVLVGPKGEVRLTPIEGRLLAWLAARPAQTHGYPRLLAEVWGYRDGVSSRTVYSTINRLRAKIEPDPANPRHLVAVAGLGYRFEPRAAPPTVEPSPRRDAFFGRTGEIARLEALVGSPGSLVAVVGPGGCGKTRLAREICDRRDPGRVLFCDLSEARTGDELVRLVARVAEVPLAEGDALAQVGRALAGRGRCMVVLDNLEQLGAGIAAPIARWRALAPEAALLLTSRDRHPLPPETAVVELEPLPATDAVALFVARARAARPGFEPDAADRAHVAAIVAALDGLPLAIELAAARAFVLSPAGIRERLERRFQLLRGAGRPDRHATLLAAIDWSWDLLAPWERAALAQTSVFSGGFTMAAAEAVIDLSAWPDAPWVVDVVQSLAERSLLKVQHDRPDLREPWLGLYVSIQAYAGERLRTPGAVRAPGGGAWSGPEAERGAVERHGRHYARYGTVEGRLAWRCDPDLVRAGELGADFENVLVACRRAVERGDDAVAVPAASAISLVCARKGPFPLAMALTGEALAVAGDATRAMALVAHAEALESGGKPDVARRIAQDAVVEAARIGDRHLEAMARASVVVAGDHGEAGVVVEAEARALIGFVEEHGLHALRGPAIARLGTVLLGRGRIEEGLALFAEAGARCREVGDHAGEAITWGNRANACRGLARLEEAEACYARSLALHRRAGNRHRAAVVSSNLAAVSEVRGRFAQAREMYAASLVEHREVGNRRSEVFTLANLGRLLVAQGEMEADAVVLEEGADAFRAGLAVARELGLGRLVGTAQTGLATWALACGRDTDALAWATEASTHALANREHILAGMALGPLGLARARLGDPEGARRALDEGEALFRQAGARIDLAVHLGLTAGALALAGCPDEARARLDELELLAEEVCPGDSLLHMRARWWRARIAGG